MRHRSTRLPGIATCLVVALATAALAAEPQVVSTSPARHAFAPAGTSISITFDEALLPSSVDGSSFRVFGVQTGTATGSVGLSNGNKTLTMNPAQPFAPGEVVLVNLSHDVLAADATPLRSAGYAFQFTISTGAATRDFTQIDSMSNRIGGAQTRIYGALAADLDGDRWIDLTTVNEVSGDLRVFLNRADGSGLYDQRFLPPTYAPYPIGLEASPNEPLDADNDGNIDIAIAATSSEGVWIARGVGNGTFTGAQSVLTGDEPHGVAVLDVDGDGDFDIVNAVYGDDDLALLLNDGSGNFSAPTFFPVGCDGPWGLAAADMNNDGITDVVAGCVISQQAIVHLGNGDGTFSAQTPRAAAGAPWQVALGDLDGDGDVDAVLANSFYGNGAILRGNGSGGLGVAETYPVPGHTPANDLGDLDGDGDLDWVISSFGANLWRIYVNDGAGNFSLDQDIPAPSNPSCSVLLDFDQDGDLDLALSDEIADVVLLLRNENGVSPICPATPATCRTPIASGKSNLTIRNKTPDKGDLISWRWTKGAVTTKAEFGSPLTSDDYALCIYDAGNPITSVVADAGGICGTKPCWKEKTTGFGYTNRLMSSTGARTVNLKEGPLAGRATITFQGSGSKLVMPALDDVVGPVTVQLHRSGGGPCFGATFSAPFRRQDARQLIDRAD
jgi:hypothetical protein